MKVAIECASQEEFESKREAVVKALAGDKFSVRPAGEAKPLEAKEPVYNAQRDIMATLDAEFQRLLSDIRREVDEIIG